ncbi:UDP-glucuronosyltransferase 2B17-like [Armigeres subalbatus]|uniref:UDP-glucuronosyltransferase 2B17-like n=1 Tax=Armigeres subalbatus TaxID=124917 RepID=UPI002ED1BE3D
MESKAVVIFLVVVGQLATIGLGANILYISSVASPSHFLWSQVLFERLAEVGHNVTVVNLYKDGLIRGVHLLKLDGVIDDLALTEVEDDYVEFGQLNAFEMHMAFAELELHVCEIAVQSKGFKRLLGDSKNLHVDLVIHDHLAGPCLLSLLPIFNYPPLILASAYNRISTTSSSLGTMVFPGFIPNQVIDMVEPMSFFQRCFNFVLFCWEHVFREYIYYPKLDAFITINLNHSASVSSLEKRSLLAILNICPILELSEPSYSSVVQAGGLHIKPKNPLPPDLLRTVDMSNNFILLSLGTNVRSDSLGFKILRELITALSTLSHITFLWKLDSESGLPVKLPSNVITSAWFPQSDLLAHPKIRLFITHGGLLSIQEAAWHGVPIVGLPIYADQFGNVNHMVDKGIGRRLSISTMKSHQLIDCINGVMSNKSYKENAIQLSKVLRDRKESPLETAIQSIEWVLRNAETSHVWKQTLVNVGFLQKYSYDVVAVFAGATMLTFIFSLVVVWNYFRVPLILKNKTKNE